MYIIGYCMLHCFKIYHPNCYCRTVVFDGAWLCFILYYQWCKSPGATCNSQCTVYCSFIFSWIFTELSLCIYYTNVCICVTITKNSSRYVYGTELIKQVMWFKKHILHLNKLSPRGRRDDIPPMAVRLAADLRPSADGSAVLTWLSCRQPACL